MKRLFVILILLGLMPKAWAQSEDEAIKASVQLYFDGLLTGNAEKLTQVFHPTALLKTVNSATGEIQDSPVKSFIAKTPAGGIKAQTKLLNYAYAGISASVTAEIQFETFKYIDLLSLLKVNGEWKIMARVYSRVDPGTELKSSAGSTTNAATNKSVAPAVKKSNANAKPKKDDGW